MLLFVSRESLFGHQLSTIKENYSLDLFSKQGSQIKRINQIKLIIRFYSSNSFSKKCSQRKLRKQSLWSTIKENYSLLFVKFVF